jgi:hypothetical protein
MGIEGLPRPRDASMRHGGYLAVLRGIGSMRRFDGYF